MSDKANFFVDDTQPPSRIREKAVEALQAGAPFLLILLDDDEHDPTVYTLTSLSAQNATMCVRAVSSQLPHIRPGMNN